ncbi:MAG: hypothetical protein H6Q41_3297, partial [Deltaproteobacteria bacterium]|nr:hypothetical protein [Deltaproteobacteria bacterium]
LYAIAPGSIPLCNIRNIILITQMEVR